jgi:hypothetical protein
MPLVVNDARASFTLGGPDFEPAHDPAWRLATDGQRRAYWAHVGRLAVYFKRDELRRGLDAHGQRLARIKQPRPDGAAGPPLSPHHAESRFQRYCQVRTTARGATIFWGSGWAKVVGGHASGRACGVVRDVIGLTPASQRRLADHARLWWLRQHGTASQRRAPQPQPRPRPIPVAARPLAQRYPSLADYLRPPR